MKTNPVNIILKQRYEIKVRRQKTAMELQKQLQDINTMDVLPALSKKLDSYFFPDEVLQVEKIEIDIGKVKDNISAEEWKHKILEKLDEQLKLVSITVTGNELPGSEKFSGQQHLVNVLIWFFQYGYLPAGSTYTSANELFQELVKIDESGKKILREFIFKNPDIKIIRRLAANTGFNSREFYLQLILPHITSDELDWFKQELDFYLLTKTHHDTLHGLHAVLQFVWEKIFQYIITLKENSLVSVGQIFTRVTNESMENAIEMHNEPEISSKLEKPRENESEFPSPEKEIFISNTGLCLLAPYLTTFFKEIGLTTGNVFIDKLKQQHAVYLLHWIATKKASPTEDQLFFPKLLCGWPLLTPCINTIDFYEEEKNECEELLRSVIQNWPVLKKTSPDGLRESFLQRTGKLVEEEQEFVVQPEHQSIDLLLDYIPWTFRTILLPWMKKPLIVEWY